MISLSPTRTLYLAAIAATFALTIQIIPSRADDGTETYGPYTAPPVSAAANAPLTAEQIDSIVAPIALYPDPLLAQILPAATYPIQIVEASRWLQANPTPSEDAINQQPWELPIKALVHYPTVLQMMNDQLDWTQALGNAFINQQADVMSSIQRLRAQAQAAGTLQSTQQQTVELDDDAIQITPADPNLIYVPQYNPQVVYTAQPAVLVNPITWTPGFHAGLWLDNGIDWNSNFVAVGIGWNNGWHPINHRDDRPVDRHIDIHTAPRPPEHIAPRPWTRNEAVPRPIPPSQVRHLPPPEQRGWPAAGTPPAHPLPPSAFNDYQAKEEAQRAADRTRQDHTPAPAPAYAQHPVLHPPVNPAPHAPPPEPHLPPAPPPHPVAPEPRIEAPAPRPAPAPAPVVHAAPPPAPHPAPPVFQVPAGGSGPSTPNASNRGHESMHH